MCYSCMHTFSCGAFPTSLQTICWMSHNMAQSMFWRETVGISLTSSSPSLLVASTHAFSCSITTSSILFDCVGSYVVELEEVDSDEEQELNCGCEDGMYCDDGVVDCDDGVVDCDDGVVDCDDGNVHKLLLCCIVLQKSGLHFIWPYVNLLTIPDVHDHYIVWFNVSMDHMTLV